MDNYREKINTEPDPVGAKLAYDSAPKSPIGPATLQPRGYDPSKANPKNLSPAELYAQGVKKEPVEVPEQKKRSSIRTFKNDSAEFMREKKVTAAQVAIAEQKRRQKVEAAQPVPVPTSRKFLIISVSVVMILLAVAIFVFLVIKPDLPFLKKAEVVPIVEPVIVVPSISGNSNAEYVALPQNISYGEVAGFFDTLQKDNSTYLFENENNTIDSETGKESLEPEPIFPADFLNFIRAYDLQTISFAVSEIEYGTVNSSPYLLLEVNDFSKVYPKVFAWEDTMVSELEPLFPTLRESYVAIEIPQDIVEIQETIAENTDLSCPYFTDYHNIGDTGEGVKAAQSFLKVKGHYEGDIDGIYNQEMKEAVAKFQNDNWETVLKPWDIAPGGGTGFLYQSTRAHMNVLSGCSICVTLDNGQELGCEEDSTEVQENEAPTPEFRPQKISWRDIPFRDVIYKNKDVRIIADQDNNPVFYHAFLKEKYVLIAQDLEILEKMSKVLE